MSGIPLKTIRTQNSRIRRLEDYIGLQGPSSGGGGGGGGGEFYYQSGAPTTTTPGARWVDIDTGIEYTLVNDGNSTQWVELGPDCGGLVQYQDEGVNLGSAGTVDTVDFTGSGVTATRTGNKVTVNVPDSSVAVAFKGAILQAIPGQLVGPIDDITLLGYIGSSFNMTSTGGGYTGVSSGTLGQFPRTRTRNNAGVNTWGGYAFCHLNYWGGSLANEGGYEYMTRFTIENLPTDGAWFVGLARDNAGTAVATINLGTLNDVTFGAAGSYGALIGVGCSGQAGDTNLYTYGKTDTTVVAQRAAIPGASKATNTVYELYISHPGGGAGSPSITFFRIDTVNTRTLLFSGVPPHILPANNLPMSAQFCLKRDGTATIPFIGLVRHQGFIPTRAP